MSTNTFPDQVGAFFLKIGVDIDSYDFLKYDLFAIIYLLKLGKWEANKRRVCNRQTPEIQLSSQRCQVRSHAEYGQMFLW